MPSHIKLQIAPKFQKSSKKFVFRKEIFADLVELVKEGLQENILKGVCKVPAASN